MIAFKTLIGLLIILPGVCVLLAGKNVEFKAFLQEKLLDNKDFFTGQHKYSKLVKWSGWQNIVVGLLITLPIPLYFYPGLLVGMGVGTYLYWQYLKIVTVTKVVDPISDNVASEEVVVDISASDNK